MKLSPCLVALLLSAAPAAIGSVSAQPAKANPDALTLQDFSKRVNQYMKLHNRLEKESPPMKETTDPAKIQASQDVLATKIRAARVKARQGEIFSPEIAKLFRRLMSPEVKGPDARETKQAIKDDAPAAIVLKVNARYPEDQPLPTVPPNILANLPKLPEDLEYRIVANDLILRDVHANLIVDFIPRVIR